MRIVADKIRSHPQNLWAWPIFLMNLRIQLPIDADRNGWLRINVDVSG